MLPPLMQPSPVQRFAVAFLAAAVTLTIVSDSEGAIFDAPRFCSLRFQAAAGSAPFNPFSCLPVTAVAVAVSPRTRVCD